MSGLIADTDSESLFFFASDIDDSAVAHARRFAYRHGRVIDKDAHALLSWGTAATLTIPGGLRDAAALVDVVPFLRSITADQRIADTAGRSPLVIGALPFDRTAPGTLIVPAVTVIAAAGQTPYAIAVGTKDALASLCSAFPFANTVVPAQEAPEQAPDSFTLQSVRSHEDYQERVRLAVQAIDRGDLDKVVLAREVSVKANRPFSPSQLLQRIRVLYPQCAAFSIDGFIGASPELLCRRSGTAISSHPLAGTIWRSGDPIDDDRLGHQLLASNKDLAEHQYVVDAIVEVFACFSAADVVVDGPHLMDLRNVSHLATHVRAALDDSNDAKMPSALELCGQLHPTPAVGGTPVDTAIAYLATNEGLERDRWAGPVGYVDANGDGEWWIGIRSAIINGDHARLIAGAGIVHSSDPDAELVETQLKLQALLATAVRP